MHFFDLSENSTRTHYPTAMTLQQLSEQDWYLAKVRVEYDCIDTESGTQGQVVLRSDANIELELAWQIIDTGHELQVIFQGIESHVKCSSYAVVKGTQLIDHSANVLSTAALSLWIDGILLPMLPNLRSEIKARLNLWDYVEYDV